MRVSPVVVALAGLLAAGLGPNQLAAQAVVSDDERTALIRLVEAVQYADYDGDLAKLRSLSAELGRYTSQPSLAAAARYWRGFAHWRHALNSLNDGAPADSVDADFAMSVAEFREALELDPSNIEARIGLAAGLANRAFFHRRIPERATPFLTEYVPLLADIERAAPNNPRMILWARKTRATGGQLGRPGDDVSFDVGTRGRRCRRQDEEPSSIEWARSNHGLRAGARRHHHLCWPWRIQLRPRG